LWVSSVLALSLALAAIGGAQVQEGSPVLRLIHEWDSNDPRLFSWDTTQPLGSALDPASGDLFVLDESAGAIVRMAESGLVSEIEIPQGLADLQGLAVDANGHLHLLSPPARELYELDTQGNLVAVRTFPVEALAGVQALTFALSSDGTDDPAEHHLFLATDAGVSEWTLRPRVVVRRAKAPNDSTLIQEIDASGFDPPSPDSAGIAYNQANDSLVMADSEVNEMPIFEDVNVFELTRSGSLFGRFDTTDFSDEPTGVAINPANGHCFFSDDTGGAVYEVDPGSDGVCLTGGDDVSEFSTGGFGSGDPEGVAFGDGKLFIVDGVDRQVYTVNPSNGNLISSCDTAGIGVDDPEGITYDSDTGNLFIVGKPSSEIAEITTSCGLVRVINIAAADANKPAGLALAPSSVNPSVNSLWVTDRGVDNDPDPDENDGKIYEMSLPGAAPGNAPPEVTITSPADGTTVDVGDPVSFAGTATDAEDGNITGSLSWTSDVDGTIGGGAGFTTSGLSEGVHVITASVTDSGGAPGADQISITVGDPPLIFEKRVAAAADDAEESAGGAVDLGSSDLELVFDGSNQTVGLRFTGVSVPAGASILEAWVQFQVDEANSGAISLTLEGQDADHAAIFTTASGNVSSRPRTSASVAWSPPGWGSAGAAGPDQQTPDLSAVIQEIVDRAGWASGNALAILVTGSGERTAESYNGLPSGAPLLHIRYSEDGNEAPNVTITSPSGGSSVDVGESVSFAATATDAEDGNLAGSLSWNSSINGSIGSGASFSTSSLSVGTHTITASVTDSGGREGSDQISLTVVGPNAPPTVTITAPPSGTSVDQGDSVAFAGTATDAEDGILSASLAWNSDQDGVIGGGASFSTSSLSVGTHTITATVMDSGGLPGSDMITLTVTEPPGGSVFEKRIAAGADDAEESAGGAVDLGSSDLELVFDGSNQTVGLRFTGVTVPPGSTIHEAWVQFQVDESNPGTIALTLEGQDADHAATFTTASGNVSSRPRTSASVAWSPPTWDPAGAAGPDQQTPDLSAVVQEIVDRPGWSSGNALAILVTGSGERTAESYNGLPSGAPLLHIRYSEDGNTAPTVTITSPPNGTTVDVGDPVSFAATATDAEDGNLAGGLSWTSSIDDSIGSGASFSTSGLSVGTHTITASVTDSGGRPGSDQITLTVVGPNAPPTVTITAPPSGTSVDQGDSVGFAGTATDAEDGNLAGSLSWNSSINGSIGSGASFSTSGLSVGTHTITASVTDSGGLPGSDQITVTVTEPPGGSVFEKRVTADSDDAEETSGGVVSLGSSDLELVFDRGGNQTVGLRFTGVTVPPGSTIQEAWVQFQADEANSGAIALTLEGEAVDDAATFTTASENISSRARTSASAAWSPPDWGTVGAAGPDQRTSDLSAVIQEIVDRPGWSSGNALAILVTGSGERTAEAHDVVASAAPLLHIRYSEDGNTAPTVTITSPTDGSNAPVGASVAFAGTATDAEDGNITANLGWHSDVDGSIGSGASFSTSGLSEGAHVITASVTDSGGRGGSDQIAITIGSPAVVFEQRITVGDNDAEERDGTVALTSSDLELVLDKGVNQTVGMRFTGVPIPAGATILDAWVQFQVDEVNSGAISLTLEGEAADDAAAFTRTSANLSSRARTSASAAWSPPDWTTIGDAGPDQQTPDLSAVIQEIVDRPGWASGNALAILVTGSGERTAEAANGGGSAGAPLIHIRYRVGGP
jgi:hypothetical protein